MIWKICVFLLIAISLQNAEAKEEGEGFLSKLSDIPFKMFDVPIAAASDALYNARDFASRFTETVQGKVGQMTQNMKNYAHEIADYTIDSMRGIVRAMKNAKDEIGETLSGIQHDISAAKDEFIEKYHNLRDGIVKDSISATQEFLKNCTEAAKYQIENALENGEVALEKAKHLAGEFIKEAKEKSEATKVEVLEKISAELDKLHEEYHKLKEDIPERLQKILEDLQNQEGGEKIEEFRKRLQEYFEEIKSAVNDGSELASKVKSKIEELIKEGKEANENISAELEAKIADIQENLQVYAEKAVAFREEVIASAKEAIETIANNSKGAISSFFESLGDAFRNGISHLNDLYDATASMVGDFFKDKMPQVAQTRKSAEDAINDVDEHKRGIFDWIKEIPERFAEKLSSYSKRSEEPDVDFAGSTLDDASSALNELWEKIHTMADSGNEAIEKLFEKSQNLYEDSKAHIAAAISEDIEYIKEKAREIKGHLKQVANDVKAKLKEVKDNVESYVSEGLNTIREKVDTIVNDISERVKAGTKKAKEIYYKILKKLETLKEQANEKLEDYKAKISVEINSAIESAKEKADEVQKYIESRFIQGSKKAIECLKQHGNELPAIVSDLTKQVRDCGGDGLHNVEDTIKESLEIEELQPKLDKLSGLYKECRANSGFFGSVSCLGKLPFDEVLGLSNASANISDGISAAEKDFAACSSEHAEVAEHSFNDLRDKFDQCMAA